MANTPQDIFTAIEQQLSAINGSAGYATQIGTKIYLGQVQRTGMKEHSIAIGARAESTRRLDEECRAETLPLQHGQAHLDIRGGSSH